MSSLFDTEIGYKYFVSPLNRFAFETRFEDNYFFREQRNEIIKSFDKDEDADKKKTFQDIGRLIGQRWREIEPGELALRDDAFHHFGTVLL